MCLSIAVNCPERVLAQGTHLGHEWVIVHNTIGFRCGYVRVPKDHPWYGKHYDDIDVKVHGGLTFAKKDQECGKGGADDGWWFGFDCAHSGDAVDPSIIKINSPEAEVFLAMSSFKEGTFGNTIKTTAYVKRQCQSLIRQAIKANENR